MKKKILFVGESPYSFTGNSNMMNGLLSKIDTEKFEVSCFGAGDYNVSGNAIFKNPPFSFIPANKYGDGWGLRHLVELLHTIEIDYLFMVGVDLWRYAPTYSAIDDIRRRKGFKWIALFPYDVIDYRRDWGEWIKLFDLPLVYSQFGEQLLKPHHPNIQYFRPPLFGADLFKPFDGDRRLLEKSSVFPQVHNRFVFGFIGNNQVRKDPLRVLEAFRTVHDNYPNTALYFHLDDADSKRGIYNIRHATFDFGFPQNVVMIKKQGRVYTQTDMIRIYNSLDCMVNSSYQEGLSWTVIEAMLCGAPIIASDTTAHPELLKDAGTLVPCTDRVMIPIEGGHGFTYQRANACNLDELVLSMEKMIEDDAYRQRCRMRGPELGKEWLDGISDVNKVIEEAGAQRIEIQPAPVGKKEAILFAQKASAGDILMTTQCLHGVKERHGGLPLYYMTSKKYMDLLEGNPYIDEILEWDDSLLGSFHFYYNPHEEKILPGYWGRNSNSLLADFYWKILDVPPKPMTITPTDPSPEIRDFLLSVDKPFCAVYSAGADRPFREYQYFGDVCNAIRDSYFTIQMGGGDDYPAKADCDLRGKLTYRQEAWVVHLCKIGLAVDTFGAHLLGTFGVPHVMLPGSSNSRVVQPKMFGGKLIILDPDYVRVCPGLGPCSAQMRNCPAPCIGSINPKDVIKAVEQLEEETK